MAYWMPSKYITRIKIGEGHNNQQQGLECRFAWLDHIYTPKNKGEDFIPSTYVIHGDSLGFDLAPVELELNMDTKKSIPKTFKWNASYMKIHN